MKKKAEIEIAIVLVMIASRYLILISWQVEVSVVFIRLNGRQIWRHHTAIGWHRSKEALACEHVGFWRDAALRDEHPILFANDGAVAPCHVAKHAIQLPET